MSVRIDNLHEPTPWAGFFSRTELDVEIKAECERRRKAAFKEGLESVEPILTAMIENMSSPVVQLAILERGPQAGGRDGPAAPSLTDMRHNYTIVDRRGKQEPDCCP